MSLKRPVWQPQSSVYNEMKQTNAVISESKLKIETKPVEFIILLDGDRICSTLHHTLCKHRIKIIPSSSWHVYKVNYSVLICDMISQNNLYLLYKRSIWKYWSYCLCFVCFSCRFRSSVWRWMLPDQTSLFLQCLSLCTMRVCVQPAESSSASSSSPPGPCCRTSWLSLWCPTGTLKYTDPHSLLMHQASERGEEISCHQRKWFWHKFRHEYCPTVKIYVSSFSCRSFNQQTLPSPVSTENLNAEGTWLRFACFITCTVALSHFFNLINTKTWCI